MNAANLGQLVADEWGNVAKDAERRERDQVSTLHDWKRKSNHRWVDEAWMRVRPVRAETFWNESVRFLCRG
jgi:hypothetical protein